MKYPLGKHIGGAVYVHKNYEKQFPKDELKKAKSLLPKDFEYDVVKYIPKTKAFSFIISKDFDTRDEPSVNGGLSVKDGVVKKFGDNGWIYHHKWQFVGNDYKGFNISDSKKRSEQWMALKGINKSKIGQRKYWEREVESKLKNEGSRMSFKKFYEKNLEEKEDLKNKIYLDMDGVLCDFEKGIHDIDGKTNAKDLFKQDANDKGLLWKHIAKKGTYDFFSQLEWLEEGKKLWAFLKDKPNVEILSSIGNKNPDRKETHQAKVDWLKWHNINIPSNFSQSAREKQKWARRKGNILIDDYDNNIKQWNKAGGTSVHFKGDADEAIAELKKHIDENIVMEPYVITPDKSTMINPEYKK